MMFDSAFNVMMPEGRDDLDGECMRMAMFKTSSYNASKQTVKRVKAIGREMAVHLESGTVVYMSCDRDPQRDCRRVIINLEPQLAHEHHDYSLAVMRDLHRQCVMATLSPHMKHMTPTAKFCFIYRRGIASRSLIHTLLPDLRVKVQHMTSYLKDTLKRNPSPVLMAAFKLSEMQVKPLCEQKPTYWQVLREKVSLGMVSEDDYWQAVEVYAHERRLKLLRHRRS